MALPDQGDQLFAGVLKPSRADPARLDPMNVKLELISRAIMYGLVAVLAFFVLDGPDRIRVPVGLVFGIFLHILIGIALPIGKRVLAHQLVDAVATLIGVVVVPTIWIVGVVSSATALVASYSLAGSRWSQVINLSVIIGSLTLAAIAGQPAVIATGLLITPALVGYHFSVNSTSDQLSSLQDDLSHGLNAAGIFVHLSSADDGQARSVVGPHEQIIGWSESELTSIPLDDLIHPEDADAYTPNLDNLGTGATLERKARFRHKNGQWVWLHDVSRVIENSGTQYLRGYIRDVTELEEASQIIREQATRDGLTGLVNRRVFSNDVIERIEKGEQFALAMLDLNRFKEINDTFGHDYGDHVLVETARRLTFVSRGDDTVSRLGGDEFAIVIGDVTSVADAQLYIDRLVSSLAKPIDVAETSIHCQPAIGFALSRPDEDLDVSTLLHWADVAMYEAKQNGYQSQAFSAASEERLNTSRQRRGEVMRALDDGELILHFQPKLNMVDGTIYGVEGLARWQHGTDGLLQPADFIDLISMSPQMTAFTDRMITHGIKFAAACNEQGTPISVAINIAARSLFDQGLADRTAQKALEYGINPSQLIFEITEQDIMDDITATSVVLSQLSDLGIGLSVDDFGTGHSSLSRLIDLPVTEVKIDRRFVSAAPHSERDRVATQSIIDLARRLRLAVVAEGVENQEQVDLLLSMDCQAAQGFLFARPSAEEQVLELLTAQRTQAEQQVVGQSNG